MSTYVVHEIGKGTISQWPKGRRVETGVIRDRERKDLSDSRVVQPVPMRVSSSRSLSICGTNSKFTRSECVNRRPPLD